jgi:hypothetical protein
VAARVLDMFNNFHLVKKNKIANNSTIAEARKNMLRWGFCKIFYAGWTKSKNNQILLNKISCSFLATMQPCTW